MIFKLEYKNKDLDVARLEIITPGLVEKTIEGTEDPFRLIYKLDKPYKSGHFLTSSAEINIYETEEFNIDALKTSNETEIKVDYYINNIKKWTGFVIPDFFSKEIGKRSVVSMVASDRIGTLKGVTLTDLNAFVSLRTLAEKCLLNTGLSLPLNTMVDLEADAVNFFNIDALSQRLVDNKGRSISCYDILSSILVASNSTILQRNAEWYIVNKLQHELGQGKLYSNSTTFTNWQDIIHNFSDVTVGARRTIIPVAASTGVYHEHGGGMLHPDNYDFSKGLTGWSAVGDFAASIDNRQIDGFSTQGGQAGYFPIYGAATENSYLVNYNQYERNVNPKYLESAEITIPYNGNGAIEVEVDVNATGPLTYPGSSFAPATLRISVVAVSGTETLTLDHSGKFIPMPSTNPPIFSKDFGKALPVNDVYKADSIGMKVKGTLEVGSLENYKLKVRIYGGTGGRTILVNMVSLSMKNTQEIPKGIIFKTEQGSNYTKEHEIETSIWGDYLTGGLNGYFYNYPIDDTSSLYSNGVLTSKWTDITDPGVDRSLLHHITTQRSRMFSRAHDLVSAEMDIRLFDPLSVYVACSKRYTLVSATVDFLRGRANLEIEEAVYQNLTKRDFIYSYFGDGESGIKSIGGISSGTGGGGSGGGMTADQVAILSEVQVLAHDHGNKEVLDQVTQEVVDNALREMIISTDTETELTDENYLSSLRVLAEILKNNDGLKEIFLSKVEPDTAQEIIKFVKGIEIGAFTTGPLGAGASLKMENGVSRLEVDQLDVRMRATFRELIIESLKHIGGQLILSPARMKCTSVVDGGTYYRCYFDTGDGKVSNEFVAGDQARCQVFTGSGVKMYWRLVTSVGADWINLSKTDAISGSSIPEAGDDIVQLGHRTDTTRQNAQILSTVGSDAPSWKQYKGINAFSLEGKDTTVFSGTGNKIDGKTVFMSSGANVEDGINSKNSNYSSQPTSYKANDTWTLSADTTVNGIAYKSGEILTATQDSTAFVQAHWVKKVRYTDDSAVDNLEIGGRNHFQLSMWGNYALTGDKVLTRATDLGFVLEVKEGEKWSIAKYGFPINIEADRLYYAFTAEEPISGTETIGFKLVANAGVGKQKAEGIIVPPTAKYLVVYIGYMWEGDLPKIMLTKGDKATDWTPAPEDVQAAIDAAVVKATYWSIKASSPVIYKDAINAATSGAHTPVTVSGELRSGTTTTSGGFITVTPNGGTEAGTASASPVTITPANGDGKTSYTVRLYDTAAKTTLLDTMTIPVVFKGASGVNAINVVLSNEADVLPASPEGVVSDYSGSGTTIRVFEGATELDYDGIGTANGKFNVTASATGITAGAKSESGLTCVFANASNMTSDNATIVFTITGKTADGTSFSLTKTQSFAKSKTGQKGDTGASAPLLYLSASAQVMKCNPDNTPQTGQTISIEAKLQNVSGTATFVATPYNDAGVAQTPVTLGGSGNTRTLTNSQWLTAYKRIEIVATLGSLTDKVTIYRVADGATGKGISGTEIKYQVGTSGTTAPTGTWLTSVPTVPEGQFLWTRAITSYTDSTTTTSYSVSKQGVSGAAGKGISSTVITYQASSSGTVVPTGTWSGTIPSVSENQYLWTRTVITYTDSSTSTSYSVGKMGAKGDAGQNAIVGLLTNESVTLQANSAGVVSSFAPANGEFWVYNGVTKVTSGITFSKVSETGCTAAITSAGAYSVSAMSADNATVVLRAVYGGVTIDKVLTISKSMAGADGVSITGVDVEFAKNTTPTTAPTTGWTTTAPTLAEGEQLWTRTKTAYSSGNPTYSTPANITPKKGDTGATGTGIESVTEEYAISTSKTVQPTTGWSTTQPTWSSGMYIWSRVKVVYKNPASTVYTGYAVSSEWEAINELEIGGRNYLHSIVIYDNYFDKVDTNTFKSKFKLSGWTGFIQQLGKYDLIDGEQYVLSFKIKSKDGVAYFVNRNLYIYGENKAYYHNNPTITTEYKSVITPIIWDSRNTHCVLYIQNVTDEEVVFIKDIKLEKGNKPTDWTPAPEDVQAEIDAEKARINDILSDNVADPSEKQYLQNLWNEIYAEYPRIWAQADTYAVDKSNYEAKYTALNNLLSPVLANLTTNSTVSGASIRTAFSQYYDARIFLQNAITNKVNQNAGDAAAVAADAQAKANVSKAVTDTFKTTINGGLISTVMILLRELNSIIETAGISGIQDDGYLPAYWSGGTYAEALAFGELMRAVDRGDNPIASVTLNAKMSSIVMLHNGHAKVGELIIKSNGQIIILDKATGKIKFVINSQDIPSVADLMSGTTFGETKTNPSVSGITGIVTLQNTISVDKNNSTLSFAADISLTLRNYTKTADASMSVDLFKNGVLYLNLGSLSVVKLDESTLPVTDSYSISKTISGIPTGTYSVKITVVASGDVRDYAGSISASTLAWNFTQSGVRYFQLGLNGLMAYYSDNHFHYTETGGLDVRGATNMPGVLFGATIGSNGAMGSWWGAKKHALKTSEKVSGLTGTYDIFHSIGHSNYQITGNAYGNRTLSIISKSNDSCRVAIYNGTTLIDNQFDIVFIGNNY